jgi:hypothetical protein
VGGGGQESINTINHALVNNKKNLTQTILMSSLNDMNDKMLSLIYLTCRHKDGLSYCD